MAGLEVLPDGNDGGDVGETVKPDLRPVPYSSVSAYSTPVRLIDPARPDGTDNRLTSDPFQPQLPRRIPGATLPPSLLDILKPERIIERMNVLLGVSARPAAPC